VKLCAAPASVPTVSTPSPTSPVSSASHWAHSADTPGECGPVSSALRNRSASVDRSSHPVRSSSQPPSGSGPWSVSHCRTSSIRSRKSGSAAVRSDMSTTAAGATNVRNASCETSAPSRPDAQWFGASTCVPVCSPVWMLFQYQPGPASS
jgi:hypothetical protein